MEFLYLDGGSYCWSDYYYDRSTGRFFEESYHCGSIDLCEEFYDGKEEVSKDEIIRVLVANAVFGTLFKYNKEVCLSSLLNNVLEKLEKETWVFEEKDESSIKSNERYYYFVYKDETVAIYDNYSRKYVITPKSVDRTLSSIVNKLIDNRDSVTVWRYDYQNKMWEKTALDDLGKDDEEYTMGH